MDSFTVSDTGMNDTIIDYNISYKSPKGSCESMVKALLNSLFIKKKNSETQ